MYLCYQMKLCVPTIWPPVYITNPYRKGIPWKDYSNVHGQLFLKNVLKDLRHQAPPLKKDFVLLHKNIRVIRENNEPSFPIPEVVTRPSDQHFITENSEDGLSFIVQLRHDPNEEIGIEQPLMEHTQLTVLQSYSTAKGYPYMPHR